MNNRRFWLVLCVFLVLSLAPALATKAEDTPGTPVLGPSPTGMLATFPIDQLPSPHAEVWFLRMGLEPGGSIPPDQQIGPTMIYTELGEVTLVSDRPVTVASPNDSATPGAMTASPSAAGIETVLQPGESVLISEGTTLAARNDTDQPATFLALLMFSAERETQPVENAPEPVGLTQQGISVATAEFPSGPFTITIERLQAVPGGTLSSDSGHGMGIGGLDLGAVEQGSAQATFSMGSSWLWPQILVAFQDRNPIDPGATIDLTAGDGYSTYDGSSSWVVTGTDPLVLLRVVIMPVDSHRQRSMEM